MFRILTCDNDLKMFHFYFPYEIIKLTFIFLATRAGAAKTSVSESYTQIQIQIG